MQALKRIGQRDDVASGHRILASDEARSIPATCHGWLRNVSGPSSSGTIVHA